MAAVAEVVAVVCGAAVDVTGRRWGGHGERRLWRWAESRLYSVSVISGYRQTSRFLLSQFIRRIDTSVTEFLDMKRRVT